MKKYTILVDKLETTYIIPKPIVSVTRNYQYADVIGKANLFLQDGQLWADIETDEDVTGLYPGIAFTRDFTHPECLTTVTVDGLSLNNKPNIDPDIQPIS